MASPDAPGGSVGACHGGPVVSIKDVTHRYGKVVALDDISLDIPSGLMVGIIGPDGVGKSTLLALIAGSKKMQQGKVTVLGGDIADVRHRRAVGPRIAYMPQGLGKNLYLELSVHDNVDFMARLFGLSAAERKVRDQGAARGHRARPVPRPPRRQALGRHEAEGRALRRAGPRPGPAHPRRAHHRRRSALAAAVLDADRRHPRRPPQHERGHLHRLHGRGAAVGLDRRDGRRDACSRPARRRS